MSEKATVLFVDDEEAILRTLKMLFKSIYNVKTTSDGNEAVEICKNEKIHVVVSDQRMPIMPGVEVLRHVKEVSPTTMRLLLTGYSDWAAMVGSVNEGEVFRFINKPWVNEDIKEVVAKAVEIAMSSDSVSQSDLKQAEEKAAGDNKLGVLVLDEDQNTFNIVKEIAGTKYSSKWCTNIDDAFAALLEDSNIAVVVTEVRIGSEDITEPLKKLKEIYPTALTLVLTSFQDTKLLIDLINQGQIFRFMPKPILPKLMESSISAAIRHYHICKAAPVLLKRHAVDKSKEGDTKISGKIMGYLQKIREKLSG